MIGKIGSRKLQGWAAASALALWLMTEAVFRTGWLDGLELVWGDLWFRLAGQRARVEKVVIVEIDEATLAAHADDPLAFWTPHYARACAVLDKVGVRTIGLDILFSVSPERWLEKISGRSSPIARNFDQAFRRHLASGRVVVAATHPGGPDPVLPASEYLAVLPDFDARSFVGATNLVLDQDGTWRRVSVEAPGAREVAPGGLRLISFPLLLALHASGQAASAVPWRFGTRRLAADAPPWPVPFAGPPGTVERLSLSELLADGAENNPRIQALRDKVVIIGPGYSGSNDVHLTPFGHGLFNARLMSGPEIHAQTIDALLAGRFFDEVPAAARLLILALLLAAGCSFWLRLPALQGMLTLLATLVVLTLIGYFLHRQYWTSPLAHLQLALILLFATIYGLRFTFGEHERNRIRSMFSRYVARDIVTALVDAGEMPALGGRALEISVLFSDIRDFTTISERLEPQEVVEILNRWFTRACTVILDEGGLIDKFIGDAIMAQFGSPLHYEDHARRSLRAALRLRAVAEEMRQWAGTRFAGRDIPAFAVGVGIHTGTAVVGNIGSSERMEYTAIGDTVNLASRLENLTKTLGCVVIASRATVERAGNGVRSTRSETLTVKGRGEPVEVLVIEALEE